ncbi:MAG: hypothetical protein SPI25_01260 [Dialister sp.]|nr:hypothetical protein [Dialister sp.]
MKTDYSKWRYSDFDNYRDKSKPGIVLRADVPKERKEAYDKMLKERERLKKNGIYID